MDNATMMTGDGTTCSASCRALMSWIDVSSSCCFACPASRSSRACTKKNDGEFDAALGRTFDAALGRTFDAALGRTFDRVFRLGTCSTRRSSSPRSSACATSCFRRHSTISACSRFSSSSRSCHHHSIIHHSSSIIVYDRRHHPPTLCHRQHPANSPLPPQLPHMHLVLACEYIGVSRSCVKTRATQCVARHVRRGLPRWPETRNPLINGASSKSQPHRLPSPGRRRYRRQCRTRAETAKPAACASRARMPPC